VSGDILTWWCPACKTLTLLEQALAGQCCQEPRPDNCPTPPLPQAVTDHNPWQETVRDLYDLAYAGDDWSTNPLARQVVQLIEERHPEFFTGVK
jgi:hypothetical protein